MLITADWVVPVTAPPIEHGAVAIREGVIVEVGPAADLASRWLDDPVEAFDGCIVAPGLVNAHTHLALSAVAGLIPPGPLHPWLRPVTRVVLGLSHDEFGVSSALGALECLESGTTFVGDISYGSETPDACRALGVAGTFFWEVLGMRPDEMDESLARRGQTEVARKADRRTRIGLSPHAPYSSGPELLRETWRRAREEGVPFAIHVAESSDEVRLFREGDGPFLTQAERLAHGFATPWASPVAYLESLGVLDGAVCIHAVHVDRDDIELLAKRTRGVVLCPRSNAYLENGSPPVKTLRGAGVRLALGTDSAASNVDLNLFAEAAALRVLDPEIAPVELLHMITRSPAEMLGVSDAFGALEAGMEADLVCVRAQASDGDDPVEALLHAGAGGGVEAVMSAGEWRIRDCRPTADLSELVAKGSRVRERARALVEAGG